MSHRSRHLASALAAAALVAAVSAGAQAATPAPAAGGPFSSLAMTAAVVPEPVTLTILETSVTTATATYFITPAAGAIGTLINTPLCMLDGATTSCGDGVTAQMTGLATGQHTFTVSGTDGNGTPVAASATWTQLAVMPTPADLTITQEPIPATDVTSATITYTTTGTISSVLCVLDGTTVLCSATSAVLTGLTVGPHTLTVQALGPGGDGQIWTVEWTVTAPVPGLPLTLTVTQTGRTTASASYSFANGSAGSALTDPVCTLDKTPLDCGTTSYPQLTSLAAGRHTLTVSGIDPNGDTTSASATWTQKAVAPVLVTLKVTQDGLTTAYADYNLPGNPAITDLACTLDGAATSCTKEMTGLAFGKHTFTFAATVAATGIPVSASYTWTQEQATVTLLTRQTGAKTATVTFLTYGMTAALGKAPVCTLDGHATPCGNSGTVLLTGLRSGRHTFAVSGTNSNGVAVHFHSTWTQETVAAVAKRVSYLRGKGGPKMPNSVLAECVWWAAENGGPGAACRWEKLGPESNVGPCSVLRVWAPRYDAWIGGVVAASSPCYAPIKKKS
jgi:hypothetical protein